MITNYTIRAHRDQKWGDARIELATSCTLSKNHTTRPITHIRTRGMDNESKNAFIQRGCRARCKKKMPTPPRPRPKTKKECTACGDRTRDQSIKSRTLYLTELRRPVVVVLTHRFLHFVASVGVGQWVSDRSYIQEVLLTACSGHMVFILPGNTATTGTLHLGPSYQCFFRLFFWTEPKRQKSDLRRPRSFFYRLGSLLTRALVHNKNDFGTDVVEWKCYGVMLQTFSRLIILQKNGSRPRVEPVAPDQATNSRNLRRLLI